MSEITAAQEESIVVATMQAVRDRLRPATDESIVYKQISTVSSLRDVLSKATPDEDSTQAANPNNTIQTICEQSRVWHKGTTLSNHVSTASDTARSTTVGKTVKEAAVNSFIYRWLTAEPDPDVIVIDLRKTWSIGPLIAGINRTIAELTPGVSTSTITALGERLVSVVQRRPIKIVSLFVLLAVFVGLLAGALTGGLSTPAVVFLLGAAVSAVIGLRSTTTLEELTETRTASLLVAVFEPPEPPETADQPKSADSLESVETPKPTDSPVTDQESSADTDPDTTAQPEFDEKTASDGL